ncbi:hypothetical protein EDD18DRAFT_1358350 [Armillaria luteobubalina]|uniref:RING-type domain-containing protein n=1 Tax=Armillaria luteobubalina TaxID=153913 RepID=A0AA39TJM5_9AGAR|nr:hypothetical protein EDD18DRAFT_1358350 [Armillaria luteobubalina]
MDDVIDIFSDEDEPPRKKSKTSDLKTRIEELEKEVINAKEARTEAEKEAAHYQNELENVWLEGSHPMLDPMHLEDDVNCELCLLKMWYPFVLPDCGHVFCQKCIQDWFAATQKSHQE